ncbi:MAG: FIST C-terminal domain-containing protein [Synergistaceae bacterium]|jgi:hypothetical protein|nr:FIST C-terminal domain-containing protein [Synergistaceae bacterium]
MKSTLAVSYELDNVRKAANELASQVRLPLAGNSCGLLFFDVATDAGALAAALEKKLSIPVVGCSTLATLDSKKGFQNFNVSLVVMTGDDVRFACALSGPAGDAVERLGAAYGEAALKLEDPPKLILAFFPNDTAFLLDDCADALSELSGDAPVFGGIPGYCVDSGESRVVLSGRTYSDRALLILLGGALRPAFSVKNVLKSLGEHKRPVTSAKDNVVYKVGDVSFVDHMRQSGIAVDKIAASLGSLPFLPTPLLLETRQDENDDGFPLVRTLCALNLEEGSGTSIGRIPQGADLSIVSLNSRDVELSCRLALRDLAQQVQVGESEGYVYSTSLAVSCQGRYMLLAGDRELEGRCVVELVPAGLNFSGFYGYGELCPTSVSGGRAMNRAHNLSVVFCAF